MKTKSNKMCGNEQKKPYLDLFGEVIITHDEVFLWVDVTTKGKFLGLRFDWYVKNYNVIDKIKTIKQRFYSLDTYFERLQALEKLY